jgi:hypothetical protein
MCDGFPPRAARRTPAPLRAPACLLALAQAWGGKDDQMPAAQQVLLARAKANGLANLGKYTGGAGGDAASASTFIAGYSY